MSTPTASSSQAGKVTTDTKLARRFGLQGEAWLRHANPWSVWTRFAVLPLLALAIWSPELDRLVVAGRRRRRLCLHAGQPAAVPQAPLDQELGLQGVSGSASGPSVRLWSSRPVPVLAGGQGDLPVPGGRDGGAGLGLVELDVVATVAGLVIVIDRMVLLFEDMKARRPEYANWEH